MTHYVYVYYNPHIIYNRKVCNIYLEFEPIYIGKGKNHRLYKHFNECFNENLKKTYKHNKILSILKTVDKIYYKKNLIKKIYVGSEDDCLSLEKELINNIGTTFNNHVTLKGPLTNVIQGGLQNPVLYGESNPMFGKNFKDVFINKYGNNLGKLRYNDWKNKIKHNRSHWSTKSKFETLEIRNKISKSLRKTLTKKYNNLSKSDKIKLTKPLLNYLENESEIDKQVRINKLKKSLKEYYNDYKNIEKHSERMKKFWNTMSPEKKQSIINNRKNNPNYKWSEERKIKFKEKMKDKGHYLNNGSMKEYLIEKHGEGYYNEYIKNISDKLKGENNPMYGQGHKLKGSKNGRAIKVIVHFPCGRKVFCNGTFQKLKKEVLSNFKPQPHRKYKFGEEKDGWLFQKITNENEINIDDYEIYE